MFHARSEASNLGIIEVGDSTQENLHVLDAFASLLAD
jgi:hypothetical protein